MADRLNRIVTRTGDKGETSLGDGTRIAKTDPLIGLLGEVDELNAAIGTVLAHAPTAEAKDCLINIQHDLFDLGGALCMPGTVLLSAAHVARLDEVAARLNESLPPLKDFLLPGGAPLIAFLHIARAKARRVEREACAYWARQNTDDTAEQTAAARAFLNRLSDLLFILARYEAKMQGLPEQIWRKDRGAAGAN